MEAKLKMVYWKGEKFWVGKLIEYPDIMTQGETLAELEENMKDAYILMTMDDVLPSIKLKNSPLLYEKKRPHQKKHFCTIFTLILRRVRSNPHQDIMR